MGTIRNIYNSHQAVVENQNHLPNSVLGYVTAGNPLIRSQYTTQLQSPVHDFSQFLDYVDSPPDSKEAWPVDYLKSE